MSTLTASHLRSPPPTLESLLTDSHDAFTQQDLGGISMDMFDPALSISAYDHSAFSAPFQPPTSTLNDGATQSPGAGPSRSTRPNRASRPTSFKTFLTLEGDEDFQQGASDGGSGFDTDGDGDEYVGDGGVNGVNEDDGADEDEDEGFREGDSDDDYDFGLPASQRSRASSSARTPKARKVTRLTPAAHADRSRSQSVNTGTAKKRSARNHIVIHSSVPADELRTVNVNATSTTSTAGNATPLGAGAAGSNRSRSASRSLPPSRTEKKFKCTWEDCGKAYTKPARLREHELSHTGEVRLLHFCACLVVFRRRFQYDRIEGQQGQGSLDARSALWSPRVERYMRWRDSSRLARIDVGH